MASEELDALLTRMPKIAEAVNAFSSESVQREAFSALVGAFEGRHHAAKQGAAPGPDAAAPVSVEAAKPRPPTDGSGATKARKAGKGKSSAWTFIKDLDFHPKGKQSLEAFVAEKQPVSNEDKFVVVVYYLTELLELPAVGVSHVGSAFRLMKTWREPSDVAASLRIASSRKGTLDTSNLENIRLTPTGRNFVDHELPLAPKAAKKK